jgi:signal transduction histidine kinase
MLFMKFSPFSGGYVFLVLCISGVICYAVYTKTVITRLEEDAVNVTNTYAELIRTAISEKMAPGEMNVVFEKVISETDIPIIVTDLDWSPTMWKNIATGPAYNRREIEPEDTSAEALAIVKKEADRYRKKYHPKTLVLSETEDKIGYLVYGDSVLVSSLSWIPLLEIALVTAFGIFIYLALHNIRHTERSNLWVALAKETAHQLGTPISSLMGWVELMRSLDDPENTMEPAEFMKQLSSICANMDGDLKRLSMITSRFSQIGSRPAMEPHDVNVIIQESMLYFKARLPLLGKKIELKSDLQPVQKVACNHDLIAWVFENLFKNAIDAINRDDGLIEIRTEFIEVEKTVRVYCSDNGRGVSWEDQKKIFLPGYTTKKRGWGLGLTLAKRIIEDYHHGRIFVSWSQKGKGTVFCIDLPVGGSRPGAVLKKALLKKIPGILEPDA